MFYLDKKVIIYDRNYRFEDLIYMYNNLEIIIPPLGYNKYILRKRINRLLAAIIKGIPMPEIYVSELQNGKFLSLDKDNNLELMLGFFRGKYAAELLSDEHELSSFYFEELVMGSPKIARQLYDTRVTLKIIDYSTPKHLHMDTGLFIYNWSPTQEQYIRDIIYGSKADNLKDMAIDIYMHSNYTNLKVEYMTLYMVAIWFIYREIICDSYLDEQELLDNAMKELMYDSDDKYTFTKVAKEYVRGHYEYKFNTKETYYDISKLHGLIVCALYEWNKRYHSDYGFWAYIVEKNIINKIKRWEKMSDFSYLSIKRMINEILADIK